MNVTLNDNMDIVFPEATAQVTMEDDLILKKVPVEARALYQSSAEDDLFTTYSHVAPHDPDYTMPYVRWVSHNIEQAIDDDLAEDVDYCEVY